MVKTAAKTKVKLFSVISKKNDIHVMTYIKYVLKSEWEHKRPNRTASNI